MNDLEKARARFAIAKARWHGFLRDNTINHRHWKPEVDKITTQREWVKIHDELTTAKAMLESMEP